MATLAQIVDAVDTYIEGATGLAVTCIKGYPDFKQPEITTPIAALLYAGSNIPEQGRRVGASATAVVLTLAVYASNEANLLTLAERLHTLRAQRPHLTAGSGGDAQTVRLHVGEDERYVPEQDDPKQLRHHITCPLVVIYE